jgi:hypothetical protein
VLEAIRRLFRRAFHHICDRIVIIRLSIHDRIFGLDPRTAAALKREADHEWLVGAFQWPEKRPNRPRTMLGTTIQDLPIHSAIRNHPLRFSQPPKGASVFP